jgi:hypothetical protein
VSTPNPDLTNAARPPTRRRLSTSSTLSNSSIDTFPDLDEDDQPVHSLVEGMDDIFLGDIYSDIF